MTEFFSAPPDDAAETDALDSETPPNLLKGVNLYLIGMMGSGKTTVGRIVAKRLGYRSFDTDTVIEQVTGQPIAQIFAESGEAAFRQLETQVLGQLAAYKKLTIATGGGIVIDRKNWSYLHHGIVVWLDVPIEMLHQRLQNSTTRPLLQDDLSLDRLKTLLEQRSHLYTQADLRVTLTHQENPSRVARRVIESIAQVLKPEAVPPAFEDENVSNPGHHDN